MTVDVLNLRLPRPLRSIHQLELTSRCNLSCVYCPQSKLNDDLNAFGTDVRPRVDMSEETFERALAWVRYFHEKNPEQRRELNLAGLGESTLHPNFVDYVRRAREVVGPDTKLLVTTNGILVDEALADAVAPYGLQFFVSLHRPEKAGPAVEVLRRRGLLLGVSNDPALASVDWAGQVHWHVSAEAGRACPWIREGQGYVFADGRISTCAFDASAKGVVGDVSFPTPAEGGALPKLQPYELCATCDQEVGVVGHDQRPARRGLPVISERT